MISKTNTWWRLKAGCVTSWEFKGKNHFRISQIRNYLLLNSQSNIKIHTPLQFPHAYSIQQILHVEHSPGWTLDGPNTSPQKKVEDDNAKILSLSRASHLKPCPIPLVYQRQPLLIHWSDVEAGTVKPQHPNRKFGALTYCQNARKTRTCTTDGSDGLWGFWGQRASRFHRSCLNSPVSSNVLYTQNTVEREIMQHTCVRKWCPNKKPSLNNAIFRTPRSGASFFPSTIVWH